MVIHAGALVQPCILRRDVRAVKAARPSVVRRSGTLSDALAYICTFVNKLRADAGTVQPERSLLYLPYRVSCIRAHSKPPPLRELHAHPEAYACFVVPLWRRAVVFAFWSPVRGRLTQHRLPRCHSMLLRARSIDRILLMSVRPRLWWHFTRRLKIAESWQGPALLSRRLRRLFAPGALFCRPSAWSHFLACVQCRQPVVIYHFLPELLVPPSIFAGRGGRHRHTQCFAVMRSPSCGLLSRTWLLWDSKSGLINNALWGLEAPARPVATRACRTVRWLTRAGFRVSIGSNLS